MGYIMMKAPKGMPQGDPKFTQKATLCLIVWVIIQEAANKNGRFALRYDSSPMGMSNPQRVYEKIFYESLLPFLPKEQVNAINEWVTCSCPKARPAY